MRLTEKNADETAAKAASGPSSLRCFILLLGEQRAMYIVATLCSAAVGGAEALLHPLLMRGIFDAVSVHADFDHFVRLVLFYLALGLSINGLVYLLSLWQQKLDNRIVAEASSRLLRAYFAKDYREVQRESSGYYVARIRSDVKDGLVPMLAIVRRIVGSIVTVISLVWVLILISWQAFLLLAAIIPVATLVSMLVSKKIRALTNTERDNEAALLDVLTKSVSAFKMVRTFTIVPRTLAIFSRRMDEVLDAGYRKFRVVGGLQRASDLTMVLCDVCSIFVGALFVFRKQMTLGSFIAFMNAFWRSATTLIDIFRQWAELHGHSATINRLVSFIDAPQHDAGHRGGATVSAHAIAYRYDAKPVIAGFSMHLEPGQSALVVGQNGSGKTTLANILGGYLAPSAGRLELPAQISAVTLPVHFPPVKAGELPVAPELLALFQLDAPDILEAYPDQLSAGQQQKLSLALALSHEAALYVLDEPLANLDVKARAIAMDEIRRRTRGRMLVMIMHGADEYVSMFDQVHVLGADADAAPAHMPMAVNT